MYAEQKGYANKPRARSRHPLALLSFYAIAERVRLDSPLRIPLPPSAVGNRHSNATQWTLYKRRPICYSLGDLFFQYESVRGYAADTYEAFGLDAQTLDHSRASDAIPLPKDRALWESIVPMMTFTDDGLQKMILHPVAADMGEPRYARGTPASAGGAAAERIVQRVASLSKAYGTTVVFDGTRGILQL